MILDKKIPAPELEVENRSSIEDLDINLVKRYAETLNIGLEVETLDEKNAINFLKSKNILENDKPTRYGLLCFGKNPEKYLNYQSTIQVSNEKDMDILKGERGENKEQFEGNLTDIIDKTLAWINQNIDKKRIILDNGDVKKRWSIPSFVLREMVVNALCHRDYDKSEKVFLKIGKDQISIENPGLLKYRIYKNNFIIPGKTDHPNPFVAKYLFKMAKAEGEGKGFTTLLKSCLSGYIDIPIVTVDFSKRVKIELSSGELINKEIKTWLETKKYVFKIRLNDTDKIILAYLYKARDLINNGKFIINLSEECLDSKQKISFVKLKTNNLIIEDIDGSTKTLRLCDELIKNDYSHELLDLFGQAFNKLDAQSKQILSFAMQFEKINTEFSARKLTSLLYPNKLEENLSEDVARGIRRKCNILLKNKFLIRDDNIPISSPKGNLRINKKYKTLEIKPIKKASNPPVQKQLWEG